ncbi:MAG: peptidoglycan DD-metalloendopeptidase family protein [Bacteroidales bacterium]|nr:peptidoglycan DD-metalloendopeptidase family protein [Bacteroidales bacterium]
MTRNLRHLTTLLALLTLGLWGGTATAQKSKTAAPEPQFYTGNGHEIIMWQMFYPDEFQSNRVRLHNYPLDSLPDDINIRLIKDTSEFCFPVKNIVTSPYGWRQRWNRPHRGVDILVRIGDPVRACFPGVVRVACPMGGYGNCIVIRHENGLETVYGHLSKVMVKPRQIVNAGDVIGLGGNTGRSTGPHLHFEVRFQYEPFDPEWILDFKTYKLRTRKLHLDKTYFGITPPKGKMQPIFKADKSIISERPSGKDRREVWREVKKGDTWEKLAMQNSTTEEKLRELNPGVKKPRVGEKIRIR